MFRHARFINGIKTRPVQCWTPARISFHHARFINGIKTDASGFCLGVIKFHHARFMNGMKTPAPSRATWRAPSMKAAGSTPASCRARSSAPWPESPATAARGLPASPTAAGTSPVPRLAAHLRRCRHGGRCADAPPPHPSAKRSLVGQAGHVSDHRLFDGLSDIKIGGRNDGQKGRSWR
jgi:hypothetical protein